MFKLERRWAESVMGGFAPVGGPGLAPAAGEVDWGGAVERFLERASTKGRLGVRLGLFLAVTAPFWLWGQLRSSLSLEPTERARLLAALLAHRVFAVRELALLLKLVACMALFSEAPGLRARTGYDPAPATPVRQQVSLPLVREVA